MEVRTVIFYPQLTFLSTYRVLKYSQKTLLGLQSSYTFLGKIKIVAKSPFRVRIDCCNPRWF